MSFPPEFNFKNEKQFINEMLKPLLARMGYSTIVDYHGTSEHGKDLIFAEVDRFGFFRYHAIQAKYVDKIGLSDGIRSLIEDCEQAFATPFRHPLTGTEERISTFYAVNGGSISQEAQTFYFNSLRHKLGANCQLIDGAYLVTLNRFVLGAVDHNVRSKLAGVVLEAQWNLATLRFLEPSIAPLCDEKATNCVVNVERLNTHAVASYVAVPTVPSLIDTVKILLWLHLCQSFNGMLDAASNAITVPQRTSAGLLMSQRLPEIRETGTAVIKQFQAAIERLGGQPDGIPQIPDPLNRSAMI